MWTALHRHLPALLPLSPDSLTAEWHRLPLWLAVAMGTGILFYFARTTEPSHLWWAVPGPVLFCAVLLRERPLPSWLLGMAGMGMLGFTLASWHAAHMPPPLELPRRAVVLEGLVDSVDMLPKGLRLTLSQARLGPDEPPLPRLLRIRLRANDPLRPMPGERLRVRALVREPSAPPYPGGWDFQRDSYFSGLGGSGFALGPAERLGDAAASRPFASARAALERRVTAVLQGGVGAIAAALLTGGQSGIPEPDMQAMRDSGLAHLLSVSGLHIAIVMGLAFWIIRFGLAAFAPGIALRHDTKRIAAPGALLLGFGYLLLTGAQVPMQRSFAMAAVVTLGVLIGRRALSLRVLAIAAMLVMAVQPAALLGPSFQMSFAAVLVLIAGAEMSGRFMLRWQQGEEWWRRPVAILVSMLLTSLLAGLATTPFGLFHFGRLQLYGVVANMAAVPLTSFIVMPAGLLAVMAMPFGLEDLPLWIMGRGVEATLLVAHGVASWPGAALTATPIPGWGLLLTSFGLLWLCLWRTRWRMLGLPITVAGMASAAFVSPPDMLISGDARLIAFRTGEGLVMQRNAGASGFVRANWLRGLGEEEADPLPPEGEESGGLSCEGLTCRFQPRTGGPAALLLRVPKLRRGQQAPELRAEPHCAEARLLVSAEPIRGRCRGVAVVDRFSVWRDGPHAIWLEPDGLRILSDRAARGQRPWVPPPPIPAWKRAELAAAEERPEAPQ